MKTRILHVSDTHIGKTQYNSDTRRDDFAEAFRTICQYAVDNQFDAVVHTGDLFDDRSPSADDLSDAFTAIKLLRDNDIPFFGIVGNHERKWSSQWLDILGSLDNVSRLTQEGTVVDNAVKIYGIDSVRDTEWDTYDFSMHDPPESMPSILCMHQLFTEMVSPTKTDKSLEHVVDNLDYQPDLILLGDYHSPASTTVNGIPAMYAGATERTDAKTHDPTVRIIEVENDTIQKHKILKVDSMTDEPIPRPFIQVDITVTDDTKLTDIEQRVREDITGDITEYVVVVRLDGTKQSSVSPSDVYDMLVGLGVNVPYVNDVRDLVSFEDNTIERDETQDVDQLIKQELADSEISPMLEDIEENVVRDNDGEDVREIVDDRFHDSFEN